VRRRSGDRTSEPVPCERRAAPHAGTRERYSGPGGSAENHGLISGLLFCAPRSSTRRTSCALSSRTCAAAGRAAHDSARLPPSGLALATAQTHGVCASQSTHHCSGAPPAPGSSTRPGRQPWRAAPRAAPSCGDRAAPRCWHACRATPASFPAFLQLLLATASP